MPLTACFGRWHGTEGAEYVQGLFYGQVCRNKVPTRGMVGFATTGCMTVGLGFGLVFGVVLGQWSALVALSLAFRSALRALNRKKYIGVSGHFDTRLEHSPPKTIAQIVKHSRVSSKRMSYNPTWGCNEPSFAEKKLCLTEKKLFFC